MPPEASPEPKASRACRHCRLYKRECDQKLPGCSTCSSKWTICEYDDDYVPIETGEADTELLWSEPLAVERSLCGLELTPAGEEQLVWSVTAATGPFEPAPDSNFLMEIVKDIFSYGGTSVDQVIADYFTNVHEWMPIVDKPMVVSALQSIRSTGRTGTKDDAMALLLLCMDMMNHHCHHSEHGANSMLYRATRRLFSLVETLGRSGLLAKLHAGLLLTAYECGHGMAAEACLTLATAIALSCPNGTATLLIPTRASLPKDVVPYVAEVHHAAGNDIEIKFKARVSAALCIGEAIASNHVVPDARDCAILERLIHDFVLRHGPSSDNKDDEDDKDLYPVSEVIAMGLSAVVSLYKRMVQKLGSTPDAKLSVDFKFAYDIVFEMCRVEGALIQTRKETHGRRLCFSGLSCLYRAAIGLDEISPDGALPQDARQLRDNLKWFSQHWSIANQLLWQHTCNMRQRAPYHPF
ncbi:uncharacterized protein TRIREDRAFT_105989 [Trichoderma reesei QM6a]|uniref:Predicted protein n=1 Tax=Hypocrea jecorina (strain QM6a) TaxID=431241 RepID=G0RFW9_HYPJQ|nr:uncharacterized protein TRIREDRAFT_105989 [Trichoderma reesei QM6a]EGR49779.1 predicted protein [Trichoderma reesei QM6a]